MMHAAGVWHQQSRPDRDDFVRINLQNVQSGQESNFDKKDVSIVNLFNTPYSFRSVMHYGRTVSIYIFIDKIKLILLL